MEYNQESFLRMNPYSQGLPFYMTYPIQNVIMTEMEYERDMERMKELYPQDAKEVQKLVDEECDKMEYEGSMMFDEYPDRIMLYRIRDRIYQELTNKKADRKAVEEIMEEDAEKTLEGKSLNQRPGPPSGRPPMGPPPGRPPMGPPPPPPRDPGLQNLIEVLLYNEMYKRRCRHNRCRQWW